MESNHSSFIHQLICKIFEDTFTQKPSNLPWHIPKHFYLASEEHHRQSQHIPSRQASIEAVSLPPLQAHFPDPSPEQPLRDTLLNSAIGLASFLNIKTLLIVSRNGGTVKRLRELTDRFHLIALFVASSTSSDSELSPRQRSLHQLANVDLVHIKCDDDDDGDEMEAFDGNLVHHRNYEAALERIAQEGLASLRQTELDSSGNEVLFCYRSYPRASCVNAFKILNV